MGMLRLACSVLRRCLKPGGRLIIVTYGAPDTRIMYFDEEALWGSVQVYCITKVESGEGLPCAGASRSDVRALPPLLIQSSAHRNE